MLMVKQSVSDTVETQFVATTAECIVQNIVAQDQQDQHSSDGCAAFVGEIPWLLLRRSGLDRVSGFSPKVVMLTPRSLVRKVSRNGRWGLLIHYHPPVPPTQIMGVGIHAGASTDLVCSLVSHFFSRKRVPRCRKGCLGYF